jgi:hypothetical protein
MLERQYYLFLLSELVEAGEISQFAVASIGKVLMQDTSDSKTTARLFKLIDDVLNGTAPPSSLDREISSLKEVAK